MVVLQSQTRCYPTARSNEAPAAAQNETFPLMMVGRVGLLSFAFALVCHCWSCDMHYYLCSLKCFLCADVSGKELEDQRKTLSQTGEFSSDSSPLPVITQQHLTCQKQYTLLIKLDKRGRLLLGAGEEEEGSFANEAVLVCSQMHLFSSVKQ